MERATFDEVAPGLSAEYDKALLEQYFPPVVGVRDCDRALLSTLGHRLPEEIREALEETEFVGVFGRVVRRRAGRDGRGMCLQYIFVFDYQAVPPHECDYEPVFVYVDTGADIYDALFDLVHYCVRRADIHEGLRLRMVPGWHSFIPDPLSQSAPEKWEVMPLSDQVLRAWWEIPDHEARFKIDTYIRDPFALSPEGHFRAEPDATEQTVCCTLKALEGGLRTHEDPLAGLKEGLKRVLAECIGLFGIYKLPALVGFITEMVQVGILDVPTDGGLDYGSILDRVRSGSIAVGDWGRDFFRGLRSD